MPPPQQHLLSPGVSIIIKAALHSSFFSQVFLVLLVFLTFVIPLSSPSTSSTTNTHAQQLKKQQQQQQGILNPKPETVSEPINLLHLYHHHFSHEYSSPDSFLNPCPEASRWPDFCGPLLNTSILSETSKKLLKEKVYIAKSMFCDKVRILNKIDCAQPFTVSPRWRLGCQEAYRDWSCSILVEEFIPEGLHSCDSTCHNVIRNCPYLSPDRVQVDGRGPHPSQYGGHPAFFCPTNSMVSAQQSEHTEDFFFLFDESAHFTCIIFNPSEAQLTWDSFPLTSIDLSNINFTFCHEYGSGTGDINAPVIVAGDSVVRVADGGQDPSSPTSSDSTQQYLTIFPDIRKVNVSHCCWTYSSALPQLYTSLASTLRRKELEKENCVDLFSEDESSHLYEENIEPEETWALAAQNQIVLQCFVGQEPKPKSASSESITHHDFESGANNIDFPSGSDNTKLYDHYYDSDDEPQFHHFYSHDDVPETAAVPLVKTSVRVRRVDNNANNEGDHFSSSSSSSDVKVNKLNGASERADEDGHERLQQRQKNNRYKDSNNPKYNFNSRHHSGDHHDHATEDEIRESNNVVEKSSATMLLLDDQDYMLLDDDEDYNREANIADDPTTETSYSSSSSFSTDEFIAMVTHASADSQRTQPSSSASSRKRLSKAGRGKRETQSLASSAFRLQPPLSAWFRQVNIYYDYMTSTLLLSSTAPTVSPTATTPTNTNSCCFLLHNYWLFLLLLILIIILSKNLVLNTTNNMTTTLLPFLVLQLQPSLLGVHFEDDEVHDDLDSWRTPTRTSGKLKCSCDRFSNQITDNNEIPETIYEVKTKRTLRRQQSRPNAPAQIEHHSSGHEADETFIHGKILVIIVIVTRSSVLESRPLCCPRQRIRLRLRLNARTLVELLVKSSKCSDNDTDVIRFIPLPLSRKSSMKPCCSDLAAFSNNTELSQLLLLFILVNILQLHKSKLMQIVRTCVNNRAARSPLQQQQQHQALLLKLLLHCRKLADSKSNSRQSVSLRILPTPRLRLRLRLELFLKLLLLLAHVTNLCGLTTVNKNTPSSSWNYYSSYSRNYPDCVERADNDDCYYWELRYLMLKKWRRIRKGSTSRFKGNADLNLLLFLLPLLILILIRQRKLRRRRRSRHCRRSTCNRTRAANKVHNLHRSKLLLTITINTIRLRHSGKYCSIVVGMNPVYCIRRSKSTCCYCFRHRQSQRATRYICVTDYDCVGLRVSTNISNIDYNSAKWWLRLRQSLALVLVISSRNNFQGCATLTRTLTYCTHATLVVIVHMRVLTSTTAIFTLT